MADLRISDLVTASLLKDDDYYEIAQSESGTRVSYKTTLLAIAVQIATVVQLTSDLTTDSKTLVGAINELKRQIALIPGFTIVKVNSLPTEDIDTHTLYLVPSQDPEAQNSCDEYINTDGTTAGWELVGSTNIDLSDYYTKLEVDGLLEDKLEADDFEANQTASANPITLETKQAGLAKSCAISFGPIQDLHGYSNPWPGGAGKNKLDKDGYILAISGNAGSETTNIITGLTLPAGTYTFSCYQNNAITSSTRNTLRVEKQSGNEYEVGGIASNFHNEKGVHKITFTLEASESVNLQIWTHTLSTDCTYGQFMLEKSNDYTSFSPYENNCPISGRTEASVTRTRKNLFNKDATYTTPQFVNVNGDTIEVEVRASGGTIFYNEMPMYLSGKTITFSSQVNGTYPRLFIRLRKLDDSGWMTNEDTTIAGWQYNQFYGGWWVTASFPMTKEIPNCLYANIGIGCDSNTSVGIGNKFKFTDFQVEYGSTATEYEPYQGETHTKEFGQTVFGGTLDLNSGVLTIDKKYVELDANSNWTAGAGTIWFFVSDADLPTGTIIDSRLCSNMFKNGYNQDDSIWVIYKQIHIRPNSTIAPSGATAEGLAEFKNWLSTNNYTIQVCVELSTPVTIQLSPEALTLLKGLNVISTDGDKVQVEFSDIPVGDYSALLDYIKSLEARIEALEG